MTLADRLRRAASIVGAVCTGTGVLILLFVAYQLWGTSLYTARAQDALKSDFREAVNQPAAPPPAPVVSPATSRPAAPVVAAPLPGDVIGIIRIPKIGVDEAVVEGVSPADLRKGPGHYPATPMPGEAGNAAIAGHRTTYGAPFNRLDELVADDRIEVTTARGSFSYAVERQLIVTPDRVDVLDPTADARLTLTTCHPKYSAAKRLIVVARLLPASPLQSAEVPAPDPPERRPPLASVNQLPVSLGLGSEGAIPKAPAIRWGFLTAGVGMGWWWTARRHPRWTVYAGGALPFLAALFMFYAHLERLLPADF